MAKVLAPIEGAIRAKASAIIIVPLRMFLSPDVYHQVLRYQGTNSPRVVLLITIARLMYQARETCYRISHCNYAIGGGVNLFMV
jgi:hypothetical protein